ncbi:MAG: multidrug efflux RND transporter permease subunit [Campylobacter sp.]|nr:multidrug efflux RND transporter permease subunit [Campylobacter sp.]
MAKFFIHRPIFACCLAIMIVIAGLISMAVLPIEEYPQLTPPRITVQATYNGADAETIAETVAAPLEDAINGVEDMIYMQSTSSSSGQLSLNIYFKVGTDPQEALVNVNNRVRVAESSLPEEVSRLGVNVSEFSPNILQVLSFYDPSGQMDIVEMNNYVQVGIVDELKRVPGVGSAIVIGGKDYSMRVWIDPDKLKHYNMTISEVISAIREQNSQYAVGKLGQEPTEANNAYVYIVKPESRLVTTEEFGNIILRSDIRGSSLKLKDVAEISLDAQQHFFEAMYNGFPMTPVLVFAQTDANALAVVSAVQEKLVELKEGSFPSGLTYAVSYDTTQFVQVSIAAVVKTFIEAMILVMIVMYMFLGNMRAMIIPMLAVPVSIIGAFAGMLALGFSINMITLFAMILAIGIVVDDAIIVVENVERALEENPGMSVVAATEKAMDEVFAPVVSIILVLSAVFIPVAFLEGFVGVMMKQFGLTLVIAIILSGVCALTLTPALCRMFLKKDKKQSFWFVRTFNKFFDWCTDIYTLVVKWVLKIPAFSLLVLVGVIFLCSVLFKVVPTGLVPSEDKGSLMGMLSLPSASAINRTLGYGEELREILGNEEDVVSFGFLAGYDLISGNLRENSAVMFVKLQHWDDRRLDKQNSYALANKYNQMIAKNRHGTGFIMNPPPISGLSTTSGFELYAQTNKGKKYNEIDADMLKVVKLANQRPELTMVRSTLDTNFPQYEIILDKDKIKMMGVGVADIFSTLNSTIGSYYVNDFNLLGKTFKVRISSVGEFRNNEDALRNIFVRSGLTGEMIPISSLVIMKKSLGADNVDRFNAFPAAKIMGEATPGYTSGQAIEAISEVFKEVFPDNDYLLGWAGTSYQEVNSSGTGMIALIFGMIFVYLILASQYERWLMPIAVVAAVPFSLFGALTSTWIGGQSNDVYFQIGLILLIGLGAKNAILIVEFAMAAHEKEGKSLYEAGVQAARLRFRPIVMTSLAFTFGVLPLVFSTGAGAASRHAVGIPVIGGMIAASTIAILFIPSFYYLVESFNKFLDRLFGGDSKENLVSAKTMANGETIIEDDEKGNHVK